jgi:branched-chain amino acid transport system permease protein
VSSRSGGKLKLELSVALAACLAGLTFVVGDYPVYLLNVIMIYAIAAMGLNLVMGYAGQISLVNGAFFGIGAYVSTLCVIKLQFPILLAMFTAGLMTALCGVVIGFPALRLSGHYLAMATLAANQAIQLVLTHWDRITNGMHGLNHPVVVVFGWQLTTSHQMFWLILPVSALLFALSYTLVHSPVGRGFMAVRDSEIAAELCGVRRSSFKTIAFSLSGLYGGIAGSLYAMVTGYIHPSSFGLLEATNHLAMLVLGGMGTLTGPVYGAVILILLPELITGLAGFRALVTGVLLLVFIVFVPQGVAGLVQQAVQWVLARWGSRSERADPAFPPAR